jgi:cell division protein FtsL
MTKRRTKNGKKKTLMKLGFFTYFIFCLFAIIWLKAAVVNMKYELGALDKMKAELVRERKMAVAQRANSYSTEKIEKVAMNRLGMTLPVRENVYYVTRTQVAGPVKASFK